MNQTQLLENMSPDLTREDAANQEVVDCLRILITKGRRYSSLGFSYLYFVLQNKS
jgi:hypothetical protein